MIKKSSNHTTTATHQPSPDVGRFNQPMGNIGLGNPPNFRCFSLPKTMKSAQSHNLIPKIRRSAPPNALLNATSLVQQISDAEMARSYVLNASVEQLESIGAGELTRLSKIMNLDTIPSIRITSNVQLIEAKALTPINFQKVVLQQETLIEAKLQKAFGRAYNSTQIAPGAKGLEKLLIDRHSNLAEGAAPLTAQNAHDIARFIASTEGQDLQNLARHELNFIISKIEIADHNLYRTAHGYKALDCLYQALSTAGSQIKMRTTKTIHSPTLTDAKTIRHRTTLLALLHSRITAIVDGAPLDRKHVELIQAAASKLMLRAAHNHLSPQQVQNEVSQLLSKTSLSEVYQDVIAKSMLIDIANFKPSDNLGLQIESPHARQMENDFAASVIKKPTKAMQKVGQKMVQQLKMDSDFYKQLIDSYVSVAQHYVYPIAQNSSMDPRALISQLEDGSNLALVMDFNHFAIDIFMEAPFMQINDSEVMKTRDIKTYSNDVSAYRGERIPLPKLDSTIDQQMAIGVGTHEQAVSLEELKVKITRPSTIKVAYGPHAVESAKADVAQACGTTGRGNIHLFGQAAINQWAPLNLQFSQEETQIYLVMLSTVMTADGGHTLSETLATSFLAANNVKNMTPRAKEKVWDMFKHIGNITQPMANENTRFNHFDMIFKSINDQDTQSRLEHVWLGVVESAEKNQHA